MAEAASAIEAAAATEAAAAASAAAIEAPAAASVTQAITTAGSASPRIFYQIVICGALCKREASDIGLISNDGVSIKFHNRSYS